MKYFGPPWPSGVCDDGEQVLTPIGECCLLCGEVIADGDRGFFMHAFDPEWREEPIRAWPERPVHRECYLRSIMGGIEHLVAGDHSPGSCYVGSTLSYRDSSLAAWMYLERRHRVC